MEDEGGCDYSATTANKLKFEKFYNNNHHQQLHSDVNIFKSKKGIMKIMNKYKVVKHALLTMLIVMNTGTGHAHSSNENYYITDTVDIPMRSANKIQSNPSNLLRMLPSDTKLQLLTTGSGWAKVKTTNGAIGWVVERYITTKKPAKVTLKEMQRLNVKLKEDLEFMTDKCNKFKWHRCHEDVCSVRRVNRYK